MPRVYILNANLLSFDFFCARKTKRTAKQNNYKNMSWPQWKLFVFITSRAAQSKNSHGAFHVNIFSQFVRFFINIIIIISLKTSPINFMRSTDFTENCTELISLKVAFFLATSS